jgi:hypothetical protein
MGIFRPSTAQQLATIRANQTQIIIPLLNKILARLARAETGRFNPPANLVITKLVEIKMSVMQLEVGQTAVGKMTFDEITPPVDGAVASDAGGVATIELDPTDHVTWTCKAMAVGMANISYTGTSVAPDVGPAVVPMMVVTVVAVPVAEHGDFDPTHAVITGP